MRGEKELTPRLRLVAEQVPRCESCVDVGCDHAQVAIWLTRHGIVERMCASDIHCGPLQRARRAVERAGLAGAIRCELRDGLKGLPPQDAVIIAGMGGDLIADILAQAPWTRQGARTLVLQPMTAAPRLRAFLCQNGYRIQAEAIAREREKLYTVLRVCPGYQQAADLSELYFSRAGERDPLAGAYLEQVMGKLAAEIKGLRCATSKDLSAISHREEALALLQMRRDGV